MHYIQKVKKLLFYQYVTSKFTAHSWISLICRTASTEGKSAPFTSSEYSGRTSISKMVLNFKALIMQWADSDVIGLFPIFSFVKEVFSLRAAVIALMASSVMALLGIQS